MDVTKLRQAANPIRGVAGAGDATIETLAATLGGVGGTLALQGRWLGAVVLGLGVALYWVRRRYRDA